MFFSAGFPGVEYSVAAADARPMFERRIPKQVEDFYRSSACCAGCQQRIHWPQVPIATRGIKTYHPSCAQRATTTVVDTPKAPRIIAHIGGEIPIFDRAGCGILLRDGQSTEHEIFAPDAFDDSIAAGGQQLLINHGDGGTLAGHFRRIAHDAGALRFSFALHGGALERHALDQVKHGGLRGLSFSFDQAQHRSQWRSIVYTRGRLIEISLLVGTSRPAWFGSRAWVEAEW